MTSQLPCFWFLFLICQQQKNTKKGAAVSCDVTKVTFYIVTTLVDSRNKHLSPDRKTNPYTLVILEWMEFRVLCLAPPSSSTLIEMTFQFSRKLSDCVIRSRGRPGLAAEIEGWIEVHKAKSTFVSRQTIKDICNFFLICFVVVKVKNF